MVSERVPDLSIADRTGKCGLLLLSHAGGLGMRLTLWDHLHQEQIPIASKIARMQAQRWQ